MKNEGFWGFFCFFLLCECLGLSVSLRIQDVEEPVGSSLNKIVLSRLIRYPQRVLLVLLSQKYSLGKV